MARLLRAFLLVMAVLFFTLPAHAQLKPEALVIPVYFGSAEKVTKAQIIFTSPTMKRKIHWKSDSWLNEDSRIVQKSYSIAVTCDTKVQGF
ncbi:MAG: hypothetical protein CL923_07410 [Deltaproteobacteria bacterium]|jgi:hypothetical protein|nr:hypothetical protein [Deltaproteobacteria bacterium]